MSDRPQKDADFWWHPHIFEARRREDLAWARALTGQLDLTEVQLRLLRADTTLSTEQLKQQAFDAVVGELIDLFYDVDSLSHFQSAVDFDPNTWRIPDDSPSWKVTQPALQAFADALATADALMTEFLERNATAYAALLHACQNVRGLPDAVGGLSLLTETAVEAAQLRKAVPGGNRPSAGKLRHEHGARVCARWYRARIHPEIEERAFAKRSGDTIAVTDFGKVLHAIMSRAFQLDIESARTTWACASKAPPLDPNVWPELRP